MPVDTNNLIQNVYDYFVNLYNSSKGDAPGGTFLSFEKIGHPVPPSDFKLPGHTEFSAELATEHFSSIANYVPCLSSDTATDTASTVEDLYQMVLLGSQPVSSADADLNFYTQVKTIAQKKFEELNLGALSGPYRFHPSYADPVDWYDPGNAANWVSHSFSVEKPTASPDAKPPVAGGAAAVWRVGPSATHIAAAVESNPRIAAKITPTIVQALPVKSVPVSVPPRRAAAMMMGHPRTAAASASVMAAHVAAPLHVMAPPARQISPALYRSVVLDPHISFADRGLLQRAILQHAPAKPVSSDKFSISFNYCLVKIQRPWFYEPFLLNKNWYVPGYKAGAFSTANAKNNDGILPAIPIAVVAVKDLQITAAWSDSDANTAQNAMAFGPFSLAGSEFENNALSCGGMQIIAWIFNVTPFLPVNPDPSLSADAKPVVPAEPSPPALDGGAS